MSGTSSTRISLAPSTSCNSSVERCGAAVPGASCGPARLRVHAGHVSGGLQRHEAFVDSFSFALRAELKDSGVTVTCLMPGATETDFFERADMLDTQVDNPRRMIRPTSRALASTP